MRGRSFGRGATSLSVVFAALIAVTAFAVLSSSSEDVCAEGVAGDYNEGDIAVINNIIANNGLDWTEADPADGSYVPSSWNATWSGDPTGKRIISLNIARKGLTGTLDVSGLTSLKDLACHSNGLTSLNVSGLTSLYFMDCSFNNLTSLNVSGLTALQEMYCNGNNLISLDVSGLTSLQYLCCYDNVLTSINVSGLTSLQYMDCNNNSLTSLDVSGLTSLQYMDCSNNSLTSLDVSGLTSLQYLYCYYNGLTSINVSGLTSLQELNCDGNSLTSLDVSGLTSLQYMDCSNNSLTSLDVSGLANLLGLYCSNNSLISLKVAATLTGGIDCRNNFLTAADAIEGFEGNWGTGNFYCTPQKVSVVINNTKSVATIKNEIEDVFTSGHNPLVTGSKTNADETLVIEIGYEKTLFWDAVYAGSGSALELKGSGTFCVAKGSSPTVTKLISDAVYIEVVGSLTVTTDLIVDTVYISVTGKLTAGSFRATDESGIYAYNGGEVVIKGDAIFEGEGAWMQAEDGRITVDGNVVADASDWTIVMASGRTGEVVIKGNVTTIGYAIDVWGSGKVTVYGDVVITDEGYAIGCWNNGTVHVKGNVTAENGYAINIGGGVVKIDGTVTVADRGRHTVDGNKEVYIPESEFTANTGGYDRMYSGDGWSVYVGKQPDAGGGGNNTLIIAMVAVAIVAIAVAVYFVFVRKPSV